ncbi:unnamed protein product, partial [Brassica oleracea]
ACYVGCHPASYSSTDDATLAAQTHVLPSASPLAYGSEISTSAGASGSTGSSHPFTIQNLHLHHPKNLLVLSVSHSSLAPACDVINLLVSTILKPRTLEVFVVSLDGLSLTRAGSSITSPAPLSTIYSIYVNPATDAGGTPLRRPDLFLKSLRRQSSSSHISLPRSIISIPHVCPPPPFRWFKLG